MEFGDVRFLCRKSLTKLGILTGERWVIILKWLSFTNSATDHLEWALVDLEKAIGASPQVLLDEWWGSFSRLIDEYTVNMYSVIGDGDCNRYPPGSEFYPDGYYKCQVIYVSPHIPRRSATQIAGQQNQYQIPIDDFELYSRSSPGTPERPR